MVFVIAVEPLALLVLVELVVVVVVGVEVVVAWMQEEAAVLVLVLPLPLLVVHLDCLVQMTGHVQCKRLSFSFFCFIDTIHLLSLVIISICMHHVIAAPWNEWDSAFQTCLFYSYVLIYVLTKLLPLYLLQFYTPHL